MDSLGTITAPSGEEFVVWRGVSEPLLSELMRLSSDNQDADLTRFTDDKRRFSSAEVIEEWLRDSTRRVYALVPVSKPRDLAGLVWLRQDVSSYQPDHIIHEDIWGEFELSKSRHTGAARLYPDYRGKRLAGPFVTLAHDDYLKQFPGRVVMILANIHHDNTASQKLFERLGYQLVAEKGERLFWIKKCQ